MCISDETQWELLGQTCCSFCLTCLGIQNDVLGVCNALCSYAKADKKNKRVRVWSKPLLPTLSMYGVSVYTVLGVSVPRLASPYWAWAEPYINCLHCTQLSSSSLNQTHIFIQLKHPTALPPPRLHSDVAIWWCQAEWNCILQLLFVLRLTKKQQGAKETQITKKPYHVGVMRCTTCNLDNRFCIGQGHRREWTKKFHQYTGPDPKQRAAQMIIWQYLCTDY